MPPSQKDTAELFQRLRVVETAMARHEAECLVRNEREEESRRHTAEIFGQVINRLGSLEESRAKVLGYLFGVAAVGSGVGGGVVAAAIKLFGQ